MNPVEKIYFRRILSFFAKHPPEERWRLILTGSEPAMRRYRHFMRLLPADPRCKFCNAPFHGPGSLLTRLAGRRPSKFNPQFCGVCLDSLPPGGAETELTMLFADVRGSTRLAEHMSSVEFSGLINRFYVAATESLVHSDALVDRLMGDQAVGLYLPGFAGQGHARKALEAAQGLLRATGHSDPAGPWLPVGIGMHTGTAFLGKVGKEGVTGIAVPGDTANITARLSGQAAPGEILLTRAAAASALLDPAGMEMHRLELKGRDEAVEVRVLRLGPT